MKKIITLLSFAAFGALQVQAQLSNAGMETWRNYTSNATTLEVPAGWFGGDSAIYALSGMFGATPQQTLFKETTTVHGGSNAVKLTSASFNGAIIVPGMLVNAFPVVDIANLNPSNIFGAVTYTGGTVVSQRYLKMTAWVKYAPVGGDYAIAAVQAVLSGQGAGGKDSVVGSGGLYIQALSNYTEITVPITYVDPTVVPDKLLISFMSSDLTGESGGTAASGSTLYVDDVAISTVASVNSVFTRSNLATTFPNPAIDVWDLQSNSNDELTVNIYNMTGTLVAENTFVKNSSISVSNLPAGMYFYKLTNVKKQQMQQGKFTVVK